MCYEKIPGKTTIYSLIATKKENVFMQTRIYGKHEKVKIMSDEIMGEFSPFLKFFFIFFTSPLLIFLATHATSLVPFQFNSLLPR